MFLPRGAIDQINWSHPANKNLTASWTAGRGLAQYDLTRRQVATIGGSGAAPTAIVSPYLGSAVSVGNANVTIKWPTIYNSTTALQTVTFAFILKINTFGTGLLFQCSNTTDAGLTLLCPSTFQIQDRGGGLTVDSGISLTTGIPYLLVFTQYASAAGFNGYFMVVPLDGSAAPSYAHSAFDTTTFHAGDGGLTLGNYVGSGFGGTVDYAAFLVSRTYLPGGPLNPISVLNRWAQDPWGPWRGRVSLRPELVSFAGSAPAATGTFISPGLFGGLTVPAVAAHTISAIRRNAEMTRRRMLSFFGW